MKIINNKIIKYKEIQELNSWFDGLIYDFFIAPPLQNIFFNAISQLIKNNSTIIDIGCGTGKLSTKLASIGNNVLGVDISPQMIDRANKNKNKYPSSNISFKQINASKLSECVHDKFDYALLSLMLHEAPEYIRTTVLEEAKKIAREIIILDFIAPVPNTVIGKAVYFVEFTAGKEHYRNFKEWTKQGGVDGFIEQNKLTIIETITLKPGLVKGLPVFHKAIKVTY